MAIVIIMVCKGASLVGHVIMASKGNLRNNLRRPPSPPIAQLYIHMHAPIIHVVFPLTRTVTHFKLASNFDFTNQW